VKKNSPFIVFLALVACGLYWGLPRVPAPSVAQAQAQNGVLQVIYTSQTTATTFANAPVIQNIGQAFHQVYLRLADSGGTCNPSTVGDVIVRLFASHDGTNEFKIGNTVAQWAQLYHAADANNRGEGYIYATGVYRDIRVVIENVEANCAVNARYSGSLQGDLSTGSVSTSQGFYLQGMQQKAISNSASGDNSVITGFSNSQVTCCTIAIYELMLWTGGGANTVIIKSGTGSTLFTWESAPIACGLFLLKTDQPHFVTVLGQAFVLNLSAATTVTGYVRYRYE
jgi:hypothetical protein